MPTSLKDCKTPEEKVQFLKEEQAKLSQKAEKQADDISYEKLEKWKSTGIIENYDKENLDFSKLKLTERVDWPNKLIIKNCPNLNYLDVSDLGLKILNVLNCPELKELNATNNNISNIRFYRLNKLETIYFNNNKLNSFNASKLPNIKKLDVSANNLTGLDLTNCHNLETLNCGINRLTDLDLNDCHNLKNLLCYSNDFFWDELVVKHLDNLEYLACQNCGIEELNANGLKKLQEIYCFGKKKKGNDIKNNFFRKNIIGLEKLNVKGCKSLELLDIGEGLLNDLSLIKLSNLKIVSVKQNSLNFLVVRDCPKLDYLDYSTQGEWQGQINKRTPLLVSDYKTSTIINNSPNLEQLYYTKEAVFYNLKKKQIPKEEFKKQFLNLRVFKCHEGENPAFDERHDRREAKKEQERTERARGNKPSENNNQKKKTRKRTHY